MKRSAPMLARAGLGALLLSGLAVMPAAAADSATVLDRRVDAVAVVPAAMPRAVESRTNVEPAGHEPAGTGTAGVFLAIGGLIGISVIGSLESSSRRRLRPRDR